MFAAVAAISFASCGNKTAQAPVEEDTVAIDTTVVEDTVEAEADTVAVDTVAAE